METVDVRDIYVQMMEKIDTSNLVEVGKVERYCQLLMLDKLCDKAISEQGASIETVNGSQRFVKSHPSIGDKVKINSQLINLEKSINFLPVQEPGVASIKSSSATRVDAKKRIALV